MNGLFSQQQPYQGLLDAGQSLLNARKPGGGFGLLSLLGMALQHQQQQAAYNADPWAGMRGPGEQPSTGEPSAILSGGGGGSSASYGPITRSGSSQSETVNRMTKQGYYDGGNGKIISPSGGVYYARNL